MDIRKKLISVGVRNLKEYGYPGVDESNILTDDIYSGFFLSMLDNSLGQGFDPQIKALVAEINGERP